MPVPPTVERGLDGALDKALTIQRPMVQNYLDRLRRKHPELSPAEVVEQLDSGIWRRSSVHRRRVRGGRGRARRGHRRHDRLRRGRDHRVRLGSAMFVLALAELHSVPVSDPEVRRALVRLRARRRGRDSGMGQRGVEADRRTGPTCSPVDAARRRSPGSTATSASCWSAASGPGRARCCSAGRCRWVSVPRSGPAGNAALARACHRRCPQSVRAAAGAFPARVIDVAGDAGAAPGFDRFRRFARKRRRPVFVVVLTDEGQQLDRSAGGRPVRGLRPGAEVQQRARRRSGRSSRARRRRPASSGSRSPVPGIVVGEIQ